VVSSSDRRPERAVTLLEEAGRPARRDTPLDHGRAGAEQEGQLLDGRQRAAVARGDAAEEVEEFEKPRRELPQPHVEEVGAGRFETSIEIHGCDPASAAPGCVEGREVGSEAGALRKRSAPTDAALASVSGHGIRFDDEFAGLRGINEGGDIALKGRVNSFQYRGYDLRRGRAVVGQIYSVDEAVHAIEILGQVVQVLENWLIFYRHRLYPSGYLPERGRSGC
jgi:hypothetical protein